jgi:hypothetical protein
MRTWINLVLIALAYGGRTLFRHEGWHIPAALHFLAVLFAFYMLLELLGLWDAIEKLPKESSSKPRQNNRPLLKEKEPIGYTGPFWNKPRDSYLSANARPFSSRQEDIVYLLLIAVFAVFVFVLLHH